MLDAGTMARLNELPNGELLREVLAADKAASDAGLAKYEADRRRDHAREALLGRMFNQECRERVIIHDGHAFYADGNRLEVRAVVELPKRFPHY
jgi:hypothetical protein